jgi:hypothetical protein
MPSIYKTRLEGTTSAIHAMHGLHHLNWTLNMSIETAPLAIYQAVGKGN